MIHPPDVIGKYAPDAVIGVLGEGGGEGGAESEEDAAEKVVKKKKKKSSGGGGGITMEEVAKHTTNTDCWVVVAGQVLNVTKFLKEHPGGELAIMTFAGKDATEEFNMIHPPDVIGKYAPDAVIGVLGEGGGEGGAESEEDAGGKVEKKKKTKKK